MEANFSILVGDSCKVSAQSSLNLRSHARIGFPGLCWFCFPNSLSFLWLPSTGLWGSGPSETTTPSSMLQDIRTITAIYHSLVGGHMSFSRADESTYPRIILQTTSVVGSELLCQGGDILGHWESEDTISCRYMGHVLLQTSCQPPAVQQHLLYWLKQKRLLAN